MDEWMALAKSGTGERGIFNRGGLSIRCPKRRMKAILGRRMRLARLARIPAARSLATQAVLQSFGGRRARGRHGGNAHAKIRLAAILGTYQSTLTHFPFLSKEWKKNCERNACSAFPSPASGTVLRCGNADVLASLRERAIEMNEEYAKRFGINPSTSITCVKPSGTVSQTVDAASGLHARHAQYYIRRVRISATDALFQMMKDQKCPVLPGGRPVALFREHLRL